MEMSTGMREQVTITPCPDYSEENVSNAIDRCIEGMGGLDWLKEGMTVAIKVNLVSGMNPDKAATTHPALVRALCSRLTERGARVIVGDSPGGLFTEGYVKNIYRKCQMDEVLMPGVSLNEDFGVRETSFPDAVSIKSFMYTSWLDQADAIINFSKLKTHAMMALSCSVKNLFGTIPGTTKPEYHMRFPQIEAFANLMVDLNEYFKPVFNLTDAVEAMEGNGPTAGTPRHLGAVLASRSPYALDMVSAYLIGLKRSDVPTMDEAYKRGLGPADISEVTIDGDAEVFRKTDWNLVTEKRAITFGGNSPFGKVVTAFLKHALATRPQVKKSECIGCEKCFKICPAKAITMVDKKPSVDRSKCIHCFCCQEFCPKGAMKVHHAPIGAIVAKVNSRGAREIKADKNKYKKIRNS